MEILQRRTNCRPGNAKETQESSWRCPWCCGVHLAPHLIFNTASSYKHPEMEQGEYSQPFPGHIFPVSGIQCPDCIHIKLPSHDQCSNSSFVWFPSELAYTVAMRTTIYTCLALVFTVLHFTCLLPVSLCSKATLAPLCFSTHLSPTLRIPALLATTTRAAKLQEHSRPIQLLILLPHHRASLSSCLFLCFSSFYNLPPTRGCFFVPSFLFPYLFLVGKPNTCLRAKFAGGKFQCSFTVWTFGWALSSQTFEDGLFYSGDTS